MSDPIHLPILIKNYLSESVRRDVENLDSAGEIWKRLDQKYGARHKLIECILQDIKNLSTEADDDTAILAMINTVESAHLDLARIHEEAEMENSTILSIIEQQMPARMSSEWTNLVSKLHGAVHNRSSVNCSPFWGNGSSGSSMRHRICGAEQKMLQAAQRKTNAGCTKTVMEMYTQSGVADCSKA